MINQYYCAPQLPATPFSFSILVSTPIRRNLPFSPVSALIFPLAKTELHFAALIVAGLDVLMTFLFKRSLVHPPNLERPPSDLYPVTLTMPQLTQLMQASLAGRVPIPSPLTSAPVHGSGPVGPDQPLFPDNLSFSLLIAAPFAPFDGSPDTSFTVSLFEVPGVPGNLMIALGSIIAQFLIERAGLGTPTSEVKGGFSGDNTTFIA